MWKHQLWILWNFFLCWGLNIWCLSIALYWKLNSSEVKYWADASSWKKWCRSNVCLFLSKLMRFCRKRRKIHRILIQSLYHGNCCLLTYNDFSLWSCSFSLLHVSFLIEYPMVIWGWTTYWNFLNNWIRLAHEVSKIWAWSTRGVCLVVNRPGTLAFDLIKSWRPSKWK